MKFAETVEIAESLPYASRVGFIAFCASRCLEEARRHAVSRDQLEKLPLLSEGIAMLWARAERGIASDPERVNAVLSHVSSYESPTADGESVVYNADITLVQTARVLIKGMRVLLDPEKATARYVAGASEGPYLSVARIYADYKGARNAEATVTDAALLRLKEWGDKPFSRTAFEGIPEWSRGELSKKYAAHRVTGTAPDEDE